MEHKLCPRSLQQNHIGYILPLVQWQEISFAQATALTWSISCFSFLGRGERELIQKCPGMVSVGCSCGSNSGLNLTQFQICLCVCVSLVLSVTVSSFLRYFTYKSVLSITFTYLLNLCSVPSWPFLLKSLYPFTSSLFLTLTYISLLFSFSLLSFHCSPSISIFYPLSLSALTLFLVLPAIFCPTIFPLGWTYGYQVCVRVCVWVRMYKRGRKGKRKKEGEREKQNP